MYRLTVNHPPTVIINTHSNNTVSHSWVELSYTVHPNSSFPVTMGKTSPSALESHALPPRYIRAAAREPRPLAPDLD